MKKNFIIKVMVFIALCFPIKVICQIDCIENTDGLSVSTGAPEIPPFNCKIEKACLYQSTSDSCSFDIKIELLDIGLDSAINMLENILTWEFDGNSKSISNSRYYDQSFEKPTDLLVKLNQKITINGLNRFCVDTFSFILTKEFFQKPEINISILGDSVYSCKNEQIIFSGNGINFTNAYWIENKANGDIEIIDNNTLQFDSPKLAENSEFVFEASNNFGCTTSLPLPEIKFDTLNPEVSIISPSSVRICNGDFLTIAAGSPDSVDFIWSTGEEADSIIINTGGVYSVEGISIENGCLGIDTIEIFGLEPPNFSDLKFRGNIKVNENVEVDNLERFTWRIIDLQNLIPDMLTDSTIQTVNFSHKFLFSGSQRTSGAVSYNLNVNNGECERDTIINIKVYPISPFIPEIYSPNNDGVNDTWDIIFPDNDPMNYRVRIYNRLGGLIFSKEDYLEPWDGVNCTDGTYYYILESKLSADVVYNGVVSIIGNR